MWRGWPAVVILLGAGCLPRHRAPPPTPVAIPPPPPPVAIAAARSLTDEGTGPAAPPPFRPFDPRTGNVYLDRFAALWTKIHDPASGYFSPEGVPYHAVETLGVDGPPDHGHESTSRTFGYYVWLEAMYGKLSKDWSYLGGAWSSLERHIVPHRADQPNTESYDPLHPAAFAPELDAPGSYPARLDPAIAVGGDPLFEELRDAYGSADIYGMHRLLDADNWFGFGSHADGVSKPSCIDTLGRGPQESVFEAVPHPCWDQFAFGGPFGYVDLFVRRAGDAPPAPAWRYTAAPDADARAIQAAYWAKVWFDQEPANDVATTGSAPPSEMTSPTAGSAAGRDAGSSSAALVSKVVRKASLLGDYLRYALFDKHFKSQGCVAPECAAATDRRGAAHYLLGSSYAWGGPISRTAGGPPAWRTGSSIIQGGHQNPLAAYALAQIREFKPASPTGAQDWEVSLGRQLELIRWVQSSEGAIGGGATNGAAGRYGPYPGGMRTFYGLGYDEEPIGHDPPSNGWFGLQALAMDRVAQLYFVTGDERAKVILDRWVSWVVGAVKLNGDDFAVPSTLSWSGQPQLDWSRKTQNFTAGDQAYNFGLHVRIKSWSNDVGAAAATARALAYYASRSGDKKAQQVARELLDRMWAKYRDPKGVAAPETRPDYQRFDEPVVVPTGWTGRMPNGDVIDGAATFLGIRSKYRQDPEWPKLKKLLGGGPPPRLAIHRFWVQADIAIANGAYGMLFPNSGPESRNGKRGRFDARDQKKGGQ